jgi:RNase P subunit RPR2
MDRFFGMTFEEHMRTVINLRRDRDPTLRHSLLLSWKRNWCQGCYKLIYDRHIRLISYKGNKVQSVYRKSS